MRSVFQWLDVRFIIFRVWLIQTGEAEKLWLLILDCSAVGNRKNPQPAPPSSPPPQRKNQQNPFFYHMPNSLGVDEKSLQDCYSVSQCELYIFSKAMFNVFCQISTEYIAQTRRTRGEWILVLVHIFKIINSYSHVLSFMTKISHFFFPQLVQWRQLWWGPDNLWISVIFLLVDEHFSLKDVFIRSVRTLSVCRALCFLLVYATSLAQLPLITIAFKPLGNGVGFGFHYEKI